MDGFDISSMSSMKRVLIIFSTWGEVEMPDNAEELWEEANSDSAPKLDGTFFSVLALGIPVTSSSANQVRTGIRDWSN